MTFDNLIKINKYLLLISIRSNSDEFSISQIDLMLPTQADIMANRRLLYRVMIILFIIVIGVQYFYLNPLNKITVPSTSQPKKNNNNVASLFFFKTVSKGDSKNLGSLDPNNSLITVELPSVPHPSVITKNEKNISSSSPGSIRLANGTMFVHPAANSTVNTTGETYQEFCPVPPPNLVGFVKVNLVAPPTLQIISRMHQDLDLGGHYKPPQCKSKDKVAIVVPFRDREEHLRIFLYNIHPVLKRQMIEYNIFVIEQGGGEPFNRAMLFNVGFMEAMKREKYDCFIFHDVDLIPENDHNLYNCPIQPRHMSVAVDKMNYQLPYKTLFGGISALRTEHFKLLNGFSNVFWGWGAEDDDMANRIAFRGLFISRPSPDVARYKMLKHKHQKLNNNRYRMLLKGKQRFNIDGLSNLNYTVDQIVLEKLFTLIRVQLVRVGDG
ncbi:unnamed protein product [Allacma fusca]|uniref:Beta-1,4-N-acetylgalactosaminyltransferase n=1 Tax=Allacma fusca TaxID=39272 RepID=A0A8J2JZA6_9HEXA|nr:unnamed protein product [Allacma fusca]